MDGWPMATVILRHSGVSHSRYPWGPRTLLYCTAGDPCDRRPVSSNRGVYGAVWAGVQRRESPRLPRTTPWATQWGQLDGPWELFGGFGPGGYPGWVRGSGLRPDLVDILITPSGVGCD